jgi:hypothetical protein
MLSNKEISQNFEVQINTLYNWRKSKPKLYRYLRNADYNFEQSKEINILLKRFAEEIEGGFSTKEILFFVNSAVEASSIDDVEHIERLFILSHQKTLHKEGDFLLSIYDKLSALGIIEKYIIYTSANNLRAEQKKIDEEVIKEYFDEFLVEV